ncbi:MAG: prepilin peptidase, partial [Nitrospirae bacterium CG_4_9_14_3_um_filter_51_5]
CQKDIPWFRNIPLFTWTIQRGRCAGCGSPISPRYVLVELLTALLFLVTWLRHGDV